MQADQAAAEGARRPRPGRRPADPIGSAAPARENATRLRVFSGCSVNRTIVLVAIALAVAGAVHAATLTLLTEENPPFNYTENGKLTGLVADLAADAVKRAGVSYTIEVLPWERAYTRTQAERDTCLFATARLDHREKLFVWVGPLANNLWGVYGRGDFGGTVRVLNDLKPYRIGGVVNDVKVEYLRENGITNIRQVTEDRMNPPRLFLPTDDRNRIDLWVTGFFGEREVAKAAKVGDIKLVFILREIPLYLACSPQTSPALVRALSAAVEKMRAEGVLTRLGAAYEKKFAR
jgi:polar amino acid transport system substrate-binding protein